MEVLKKTVGEAFVRSKNFASSPSKAIPYLFKSLERMESLSHYYLDLN